MNRTFRELVQHYRGPPPVLTHQQDIKRLYRKSLKTCYNWAIDRDLFLDEASKIRQAFNANRHLAPSDPEVKHLIRVANEKLQTLTHPDPYVIPWMPGGSKFMRNPPLPLDAVYDEESHEAQVESPVTAVNIDFTPLPVKSHVLVDFSAKEYQA